MKRFFHRILPAPHKLSEGRLQKLLGESILHRDLWRLQRDSVSLGVAVGLFWAFIPVPAQMILTAVCARILRCNLPAGLLMCWVTNPFTIFAIFLFNYKLGLWLTFSEHPDFSEINSLHDFIRSVNNIWLPLGAGSVAAGLICSLCGYFSLRTIWNISVIRKMRKRSRRAKLSKKKLS